MALSIEEAFAVVADGNRDGLRALCHAVREGFDFAISSDVTATARNARKAEAKLKARIDNLGEREWRMND